MTLIDGKLIQKPITVESGMNDVGQCIGSSSTDWGTLCTPVKNGTSSNINGMSEKKPIHNPSNGELADADFRGTPTSIGEGKIYGMQVGCPSNNPYYIHNANWDYVDYPKGGIGISPYRIVDFHNYYKEAIPTMYGDNLSNGQEINFTSDSTLLSVKLQWMFNNNLYGVSPLRMVWDVDATPANKGSQTYLYIVIDNYMTMMQRGKNDNTARPIYENSTEYDTFHCPVLPDAIRSAGTRSVTIVLGPYLSDRQPGTWKVLKADDLYSVSGKFISLPYVANLQLEFKVLNTQPLVFKNMSIALPADSSNMLTCTWAKDTQWGDFTNRRISFTTYKLTGGKPVLGPDAYSVTVTDNMTTYSELVTSVIMAAGWIPMSGDVYSIEARFEFKNGDNWEPQFDSNGQFIFSVTKTI